MRPDMSARDSRITPKGETRYESTYLFSIIRALAGGSALVEKDVQFAGAIDTVNQAFIVEIFTTSVREATAKATWCWYACNLDVELKKLEADARTAAKGETKQVETAVKAKAREQVEHVKVRFRFET